MSDQAEEQLSKDSDSDFVSFLRDLRDPRPLPGSSICEASDSAEGVLNQSTTHDGTLPYAAGLGVDPQAVQKSAETTNTRPKRFRNPEVNRRAAKRFRERHKGQLQKLQAELAASHAKVADMQQVIQTLQSGSDQLTSLRLAQTYVPALPQHFNWQGHDVVDRALLRRVLPIWRSGKVFTYSLTSQQADDISQLSHLAPQQIAILWQNYTRHFDASIKSTGHDMACPEGFQLRQAVDEFACIHACKARADPKGHKTLISSPRQYSGHIVEPSFPSPDYRAAVPIMQFTERQIRKLLALRRTYITQLVLMSRHRQQLLRQLQNQSPSQDIDREYLSSRHVTIDAMPKQLEECEKMEYVLYMQYVVAVAHGVLTTWQSCVYVIYVYPHFPDLVAAMNALAEAEGEPSFHDIAAQAASDTEAVTEDEPFEFDKRQISGNPNAVAVASMEESQVRSEVADKAVQVVVNTLAEDLHPDSIFCSQT